MSRPKPIVLIILDGWGYGPKTEANAIALARKPTYDRLLREYPNTLIHTSGPFVGLPEGQMGNSEVGHLNIGAGRIVHMDITRIDLMIRNGDFFSDPTLVAAMKHARTGEPSPASLRARFRRRRAFAAGPSICAAQDGETTMVSTASSSTRSWTAATRCQPTARDIFEQLQQKMREYNSGKIASVNGRYYAMDRDRRWERIAKAYNAMVLWRRRRRKVRRSGAGMKDSYNKGVTDEFVIPFVCTDSKGEALATIRDEDSCICFNFRADRVRQITRALARNSGLNENGGNDLPGAAISMPRFRAIAFRRIFTTCA